MNPPLVTPRSSSPTSSPAAAPAISPAQELLAAHTGLTPACTAESAVDAEPRFQSLSSAAELLGRHIAELSSSALKDKGLLFDHELDPRTRLSDLHASLLLIPSLLSSSDPFGSAVGYLLPPFEVLHDRLQHRGEGSGSAESGAKQVVTARPFYERELTALKGMVAIALTDAAQIDPVTGFRAAHQTIVLWSSDAFAEAAATLAARFAERLGPPPAPIFDSVADALRRKPRAAAPKKAELACSLNGLQMLGGDYLSGYVSNEIMRREFSATKSEQVGAAPGIQSITATKRELTVVLQSVVVGENPATLTITRGPRTGVLESSWS